MKVLVLDGNENHAVAAVRALNSEGHEVVVGADSSWSKAGWSRAASSTFTYPAPQTNIDAFVARIVAELCKSPAALVLPMTERTTIPISQRRAEIIQGGGLLVLPAHETVMRAFNKRYTTELARSLGITVPVTVPFSDRIEAEGLAESQSYPVVLKAQTSEEVSVDSRVLSTGSPRYARNAEEFLNAYEEMSHRCSSFLAQEFVEGVGTGYFALMHQGELRAEFAHRRIRDVRPTGSGSAVRASIEPDVQVRNAALSLLRELRWHGVAMVEFRQRQDGTPVFMEVNGRFWNSLALAIYSGVDFPSLLVCMAEQGDIEVQTGYETGLRCRWLLGDMRHLVEVLRGAPNTYPGRYPGRLRTLRDFFIPVAGTRHDNFIWNDPLPEVGDWLDFFVRRLPARTRKSRTDQSKVNAESRYSLS
jgi:predicted ATP-grasp superfamily ATP-dependent carboligase